MKIFYTLLLSGLSHLAFGQTQYLERPKFLLELSGIASKDFTVQTSAGKTSKGFGRARKMPPCKCDALLIGDAVQPFELGNAFER